jgi:hypothetical protein
VRWTVPAVAILRSAKLCICDGIDQDRLLRHSTRNEELAELLKQKSVDIAESRSIDLHFWATTKSTAKSIEMD